jgi:hypothetical protein
MSPTSYLAAPPRVSGKVETRRVSTGEPGSGQGFSVEVLLGTAQHCERGPRRRGIDIGGGPPAPPDSAAPAEATPTPPDRPRDPRGSTSQGTRRGVQASARRRDPPVRPPLRFCSMPSMHSRAARRVVGSDSASTSPARSRAPTRATSRSSRRRRPAPRSPSPCPATPREARRARTPRSLSLLDDPPAPGRAGGTR